MGRLCKERSKKNRPKSKLERNSRKQNKVEGNLFYGMDLKAGKPKKKKISLVTPTPRLAKPYHLYNR